MGDAAFSLVVFGLCLVAGSFTLFQMSAVRLAPSDSAESAIYVAFQFLLAGAAVVAVGSALLTASSIQAAVILGITIGIILRGVPAFP